ncbi:hypothetical protein JUJ52_03080 [Virgibacillus sp. AGTR]|uniref:hypothetical protein n=1 Tax=Virgibacillus sp. AGTR TaxID=2812055 RepID=UPI001D165D4A|nr:hypothetical protein [Virgibacillus sp. AGTR]MCC2248941.1 hypothetical protein [Virgibacillus sp. AGTR]
MKIAVIVEGGVVQNVLSNQENVDIVIVDYDTEGADEEETTTVLENEAYVYGGITKPEVNKKEIDQICQDASPLIK